MGQGTVVTIQMSARHFNLLQSLVRLNQKAITEEEFVKEISSSFPYSVKSDTLTPVQMVANVLSIAIEKEAAK